MTEPTSNIPTIANGRVYRNGQVAVLVSPGHGAGWSTWGGTNATAMLFCPALVLAILDGQSGEALQKIADQEFPDEYAGGIKGITVGWVTAGSPFRIEEYDGSESLVTPGEGYWVTA